MSKKSYNAPTVPWYARPDTKPLRPRPPRPINENWLQDKIIKSRYLREVYKWVRANWHDGDYFYMLPGAPDATNYSIADRFGIYRDMKAQGYLSRIFVSWLDDGHKINMEVVTFYRYGVKLDLDGNAIELPEITFLENK